MTIVREISTDGGATYEPLPVETYTGTGIYEPALQQSSGRFMKILMTIGTGTGC